MGVLKYFYRYIEMAESSRSTVKRLSRVLITGELSPATPECVKREISIVHNVPLSDIYNYPRYTIDTVGEPLEKDEDYASIAWFVSGSAIEWTMDKLMIAYNFLLSFATLEHPMSIPPPLPQTSIRSGTPTLPDLKHIDPHPTGGRSSGSLPDLKHIGPQTPEHPTSVNACILYALCKANDITLHSHSTMEDMKYGLSLLSYSQSSLYNMAVISASDSKSMLISLLIGARPGGVPGGRKVRKENIAMCISKYQSIADIRKFIIPRSVDEAVTLAALNYNIDISDAGNPCDEYVHLHGLGDKYIPRDPCLLSLYNKDKRLLSLSETFSHRFPKAFYKISDLTHMCQSEGYDVSSSSLDDMYKLCLQNNPTFHHPSRLKVIPSETHTAIGMVDVNDVSRDSLLYYGTIGGRMWVTTAEECSSYFHSTMYYSNPFDGKKEPLSLNAVRKLRSMVREEKSSPWTNLLKIMEIIDNIPSEIVTRASPLIREYNGGGRTAINAILTHIMECGYYMRGWNGPGSEFPIDVVPSDKDNSLTEIRTIEAISRMRELCSKSEYRETVMNLPLLLYTETGDMKITISNSETNGYTLDDRFKIIEMGESTSSLSSCIRTSSNHICASIHTYMKVLKMDEPFHLSSLRRIF